MPSSKQEAALIWRVGASFLSSCWTQKKGSRLRHTVRQTPPNSFTCWRSHSLSCKETMLRDITGKKTR